MAGCLYAIAMIFLLFWVIGFIFHYIVSPLVHLLLVVAVIVFLYQLITGGARRS